MNVLTANQQRQLLAVTLRIMFFVTAMITWTFVLANSGAASPITAGLVVGLSVLGVAGMMDVTILRLLGYGELLQEESRPTIAGISAATIALMFWFSAGLEVTPHPYLAVIFIGPAAVCGWFVTRMWESIYRVMVKVDRPNLKRELEDHVDHLTNP